MDTTRKYIRKINGVKTKEYRAWSSMKTRCYNHNAKKNITYKTKNIQVCDRWLKSFENFIDDMGKAPSKNHSLDRIDNSKGYFPDNCRWATQKTQVNNRGSFNKVFTYNGKTLVLKDWARELNLEYSGLRKRIFNKGMSFEEAIDKTKIYKLVEYKGMKKTLKEWALFLNIPVKNLYDRKSKGWTIEKMFETPVKTKI
jgi:hypothetical protein